MECPKCNHENRADATFCSECAAPLPLACPQCGRALTPASVEAPPPDTGLTEEPSGRSDTPTDAELDITVPNEEPPNETEEISLAPAPQPPGVCPHCGHEAESALRLVLDGGNGNRIERRLGDTPIIIGKDETCDVVIADDDYVSRKHARASLDQDLCYLEDLGSSNGTLLRVRRPIVIEAGDEIVVGSTVVRLVGSSRTTV